jgi:hypothetical protein
MLHHDSAGLLNPRFAINLTRYAHAGFDVNASALRQAMRVSEAQSGRKKVSYPSGTDYFEQTIGNVWPLVALQLGTSRHLVASPEIDAVSRRVNIKDLACIEARWK